MKFKVRFKIGTFEQGKKIEHTTFYNLDVKMGFCSMHQNTNTARSWAEHSFLLIAPVHATPTHNRMFGLNNQK